jgi:hypothetical protein
MARARQRDVPVLLARSLGLQGLPSGRGATTHLRGSTVLSDRRATFEASAAPPRQDQEGRHQMLAQTPPRVGPANRPEAAAEVFLDCPDCLGDRLFVSPGCSEHDGACPERVCIECGAAVVLVQPTAQPRAPRVLRHVA